MNIYIGNLSYNAGEDEIRTLFEEYGEVHTVKLVSDRETGRLKGFGFIEMEQIGGRQAIEALNGQDFNGRDLIVNEARERTPRRESRPRRSY
jgi:RNA recognition motif-containing protein